jgi:hypothetical protein
MTVDLLLSNIIIVTGGVEEEEEEEEEDEEEEEGRGNRDWLDWFYTMSRVMVLFSIVYFYSSPTRFVIVSALGLMLYL